MAPMFCTKLFQWGKHRKDGQGGPAKTDLTPLREHSPPEEGEACPYWTHVQCSPPPTSAPHTPTHPQTPVVSPYYQGSPVHHQPSSRSPLLGSPSMRRKHSHSLGHSHNHNHHVKCHAHDHGYSPHSSPVHSPLPHSPVHHSPVHHSPVHHSPSQFTPVSHHSPGQFTPVSHHSPGQYTPSHHSPGQFTPVSHHSPGQFTPVSHHSPGQFTPVSHHSPGQFTPVSHHSPGQFTPVQHSPVQHPQAHHSPVQHPQAHHSPVQHVQAHQSPVQHSPVQHSPVQFSSAFHTPTRQSPIHHSPVHHGPIHSHTVHPTTSVNHMGYILEETYCQPLPPPPPLRPPPPIPQDEGSQLKSAPSASSSRSTSPANNNNGAASFIPTPRGHGARASLNEKHSKLSGGSNLARSAIRGSGHPPPTTAPPPVPAAQHSAGGAPPPHLSSPYHHSASQGKQHKDSMLDKFKLFNHKDKDGRNKTSSSGVSKRTSSSSGFSSARSERSDSSASLCSDAKPPPLPPHQNLPVAGGEDGHSTPAGHQPPASKGSSQQQQGLKGFRSKFSKNKEGKDSPKSSRKEKEEKEARSSPRSGHKSHRGDAKEPRGERGESRDRHRDAGGGGGGNNNNNSNNKASKSDKLSLDLDSVSKSRQYAPAIEPDNPIKTSKISSLVPRPEAPMRSIGGVPNAQESPVKGGTTANHPPKETHTANLPQGNRTVPPSSSSTPSSMSEPNHPQPHLPASSPITAAAGTPGSPLPTGPHGTGIPKPTAHVKGTTKTPQPEKGSPTGIVPASSQNLNSPHATPKEYQKMVKQSSSTQTSKGTKLPGDAHPGETPQAQVGTPEAKDPKGSLPRQKQLGRREDSSSNISVAMVSPMPNNKEKEFVTPSESGSNISESSHSNSGHSNSNSSGNSSVIYKPESSDDSSSVDIKGHVRKQSEDKLESEEGDDVILNIKPMQPLVRASQYGYMRGLGLHAHRTVPPSLHVSRLALQDNANTVPQKGMKVGLHPTKVSSSRPQPSSHNQFISDTDYSDLESVDLTNGYMSDGDVLRSVGYKSGTSSDLDGYLSEGGASLYAHRINQRLKEGMRQVHESMNKVQHFNDDSFDDSSSLSSGVSDTMNDEVLSSSLSSDHPSLGKGQQQGRSAKEVSLKLPVGLGGSSSRKVPMGVDPSGAYRVVSSKAHVKKTESAQQTENSAFKQISNTQWKKYVENGKSSLERSARDLQRGVDPLAGSRRQDQKKNLASPQTSLPSSPALSGSQGLSSPSAGGPRKLDKKGAGGERRRGESERSSGRDKSMVNVPQQVNGDSKKIVNPKMAPSNFGYNGKRTTASGSVPASNSGNKAGGSGVKPGRDADLANLPRREGSSHSLERPRTKLKVSGGTQTTSDLQYMPAGVHSDGEYSSNSLGRKYQLKSYSLNGPVAAQLSQSVRERIMQSPYSKVNVGDFNIYSSGYYRERSPRMKPTDGSLSDSPYSNYAELQYSGSPYSSPYTWVTRNNYSGSVASAPTRPLGGSLTEAESMESISSSASSVAAQIQHARATSLTQARLLMHQRELSSSPSPRLARSNSVSHLIERTFPRSTKSEKLYMSGSSGRDGGAYHASQPTSPTPPASTGGRLPVSPLNTVRGSPYYSTVIPRTSIAKDDDCHGSSLSLVSSSSSLYSSQEEKHAAEVRKLRKDLTDAQEKVLTLTNQLSTNAHVVAAFEQSLTNMTNRLQQLTATSEQKESELMELRKTIESLRQQSVDAGLTVACLQSTSCGHHHHHHHHHHQHNKPPLTSSPKHHHHMSSPPLASNASCSVLNVTNGGSSRCGSPEKASHDLVRRHTFTGNCRDLIACEIAESGGNLVRGTSVESVSSMSSACSNASHTSAHDKSDSSKSGKKKGWLRSSFSKAFSRGQKKGKHISGSVSDAEDYRGDDCSAPSSPLLQRHSVGPNGDVTSSQCNLSKESKLENSPEMNEEEVEKLKVQLREKDMVLTDIRLEALTSAHQLESLKETVNKMRSEMITLKHDNDRLQRLVSSKSLNSSQSSLPVSDSIDQRLSLGDEVSIPDSTDVLLIDPSDKDGKRVTISVYMGCHGEIDKYVFPSDGYPTSECVIGAITVSGKTKWDMLDNLVKRIFKEYILRIDPATNLGLSAESILSYHIGEITRGREPELPELLPCGYLVGDVSSIRIVLKGASINQVDALAFETLIPKSIVQRYVSLLTEHRRIILCGPSGTGKTYLAHKLAQFLVSRLGKDPSPGNIATFNVDHKTGKDLGAYLSHISEQCESNAADLPLVIILDNLHHAGALTDVFNGFLSAKYTQCPFIIGTMNQATSCSTTNLQLHHNFSSFSARWVLMASHMEPVKGLVGRVARRKLTEVEVEVGSRQPRLQQILDWLPRCWLHINKFLEAHSSSDVTIGPRLFLSCPGSLEGSQVWFTDLWNYSLVPYLLEAVREGLQLYGKRAMWEDPSSWIVETYPWPPGSHAGPQALITLRPEDVGYDTLAPSIPNSSSQDKFKPDSQGENDPLLSMLMRLQEAANYSNPQQDSDTASLENMENALESTI
ncbi:uncharacterized protein LOC143033284 isoform X3 [Oratosquilla oratoria]|uniref:uncharacterized protein LOC143033284 isoform X3 n=1 Tax=Oratosquilla oratoria TaxID=337810 RepID=UPI003F75FBED